MNAKHFTPPTACTCWVASLSDTRNNALMQARGALIHSAFCKTRDLAEGKGAAMRGNG